MTYLERIRVLENTKETKKVCIDRATNESELVEEKESPRTKETKKAKQVVKESVDASPTAENHRFTDGASRVEETKKAPLAPLLPGWLVVYRNNQTGILAGGDGDRDHGTVARCQWNGNTWTVVLTDGQRLPLKVITAVSKTDAQGQILAGWVVRAHGYDGEGRGLNDLNDERHFL